MKQDPLKQRKAMEGAVNSTLNQIEDQVEQWFMDGVNWTLRPQRIFSAVLRALVLQYPEDHLERICKRRLMEEDFVRGRGGIDWTKTMLKHEEKIPVNEKMGLLAQLVALLSLTNLDDRPGVFPQPFKMIAAAAPTMQPMEFYNKLLLDPEFVDPKRKERLHRKRDTIERKMIRRERGEERRRIS